MATLRLPSETAALVERIARRTGRSKSRVIRDAIALLAERENAAGAKSPHDAVAHLIGIVDSSGKNLSDRTGRRFTRLIEGRRRSAR